MADCAGCGRLGGGFGGLRPLTHSLAGRGPGEGGVGSGKGYEK